jgi:hypothetical protein
VERQVTSGKWSTVAPPLPTSTSGCTLTPCYLPCPLHGGDACYEAGRSTASAWLHPVVYGRVVTVPAGSPPPPGITTAPGYLVRHWLFYEFDDRRSANRQLWQAHEGDWENITVGLAPTLTPLFAAYSEHPSAASVAGRPRCT